MTETQEWLLRGPVFLQELVFEEEPPREPQTFDNAAFLLSHASTSHSDYSAAVEGILTRDMLLNPAYSAEATPLDQTFTTSGPSHGVQPSHKVPPGESSLTCSSISPRFGDDSLNLFHLVSFL